MVDTGSCSKVLSLDKRVILPDSELMMRLKKNESAIHHHIVSQTPFVSPDESFVDPSVMRLLSFLREQENPRGFDLVSVYRGLNSIPTAYDVQNSQKPIWTAPVKSHAAR